MNGKMKTLQLSKYNTDYPVTLEYDKCKSGESKYGPWNLYGVDYNGEQQAIFAEDELHDKLKKYAKGAKLIIRRNQDADGKLSWSVVPANGNNKSKPTKTYSSYLDDRTRDIHRQVALKIASISIGQNNKPWTGSDLAEIKDRMDRLLVILDGNTSNDILF